MNQVIYVSLIWKLTTPKYFPKNRLRSEFLKKGQVNIVKSALNSGHFRKPTRVPNQSPSRADFATSLAFGETLIL